MDLPVHPFSLLNGLVSLMEKARRFFGKPSFT
jgi:hypothetical protein